KRRVCLTPESGHVRCNGPCPLWAKSGHCVATELTAFEYKSRARRPRLTSLPSIHYDDLRRVDRIARMAEIANGAYAPAGPLQHDEISRLARGIARIPGNDRRVPVDGARLQMPVVHAGVIAEIAAHLRATGHARLAH